MNEQNGEGDCKPKNHGHKYRDQCGDTPPAIQRFERYGPEASRRCVKCGVAACGALTGKQGKDKHEQDERQLSRTRQI